MTASLASKGFLPGLSHDPLPLGVASWREVTSVWGHPDPDGKGCSWEAVMGHPVRWGESRCRPRPVTGGWAVVEHPLDSGPNEVVY